MDRSPEVKSDPRRALPAVDRLVDAVLAQKPVLPAWAALEGVRRGLAEARESLSESPLGGSLPEAQLLQRLAARSAEIADALCSGSPRRVVSNTGQPGGTASSKVRASSKCQTSSSTTQSRPSLESKERTSGVLCSAVG